MLKKLLLKKKNEFNVLAWYSEELWKKLFYILLASFN